jgi:Lar family restriction alleviation protein
MGDPVYYTTSRAKLEIKTCPFCGGDKFLVQTYDGRMRVSCNKCSARGPLSDIENPRDGDAIVAWNQRDAVWGGTTCPSCGKMCNPPEELKKYFVGCSDCYNSEWGKYLERMSHKDGV